MKTQAQLVDVGVIYTEDISCTGGTGNLLQLTPSVQAAPTSTARA